MSRLEEQALRADRLLVPVELGDVTAATIRPPRFIVRPLIPRGSVTLLGAHGGAGKTILAETLAAHVAGGAHTWAGLQIDDGNALFVTLEDPGEVIRHRLRHIVEEYGLDPAKVGRRLRLLDGTEAAASLASEYSDAGVRRLSPQPALEELAEAAHGCALIVIDNASDAFDAGENDRRLVRGFLRMLTGIAREADAGLVLLAHIDKAAARNGSGGNTYSGSTAWHNSARSRIALTEEDGRIELRHEKLNLGRRAEPIALRWSDGGVLVPATGSAKPSVALEADDDGAVLATLQAAAAAGIVVPAARSGSATALHVLADFPELPKALQSKTGRPRFWKALTRLQRQGLVRQFEHKTGNRNSKMALEIVSSGASVISPHTPLRELTRLGASSVALVPATAGSDATHATDATCPACDGEGCPHCTQPQAA